MTRLYLFDDARARAWRPFSLTRPVGEILFGCFTLRERAERVVRIRASGHLSDPLLDGFDEPGAPPLVTLDQLGEHHADTRILLSSRFALDRLGLPAEGGSGLTLRVAGRTVGWVLPAGAPPPTRGDLDDPDGAESAWPTHDVKGSVLEWPWSLVDANPARVSADIAALHRASNLFGLSNVHIIGDHHASIGPDAHIEPGVVLDTREGPIRLDSGAYVEAPARLTGPLYVGAGTRLFGGRVGRSSIGPACKVRGEVEASVLSGFCNKAHDGYLGHALLGRWVNLGAMTTNSDLKNNYSPVRVRMGGEEVDTALIKVGCLLGDHVRTGIGTLLTTGAVVGAGSNVLADAPSSRHFPPFSWATGGEVGTYKLEPFLRTAATVMERRGLTLSEGQSALLSRAWESTRAERS